MQITLARTRQNAKSTVGSFFINGSKQCVTLEDAHHVPKIPEQTRIPAGTYDVLLRTVGDHHGKYLLRFGAEFHKGMLWLQSVPGFSFVLVHLGNTIVDTKGCILVGSEIVEPNSSESFSLLKSEAAYKKIYPPIRDAILAGETVSITITDPATPEPLVT